MQARTLLTASRRHTHRSEDHTESCLGISVSAVFGSSLFAKQDKYGLFRLSQNANVPALSLRMIRRAESVLVCRLPFVLIAALVLSGCALPNLAKQRDGGRVQFASHEQAPAKTVYVVGHGWHTGLVLRSSDISPEVLPEVRDFWNSEFIELGWGDEGFYRAKKITAPLVLRAAFWPTPSVLHVAGFRGSVERFYQVSDIVEISLSNEQFHKLCRFVGSTFARTGTGNSMPLGPGIYGDSTFYRAEGSYYMPKTCNVWTAKALKEAGFPITPQLAVTAGNILSQTRRFGRVRQESPRGLKKIAILGSD